MPDNEIFPIRSPSRRPLRAYAVPPGATEMAIPADINPEYHWIADVDNTVATGGLVDRLLNRGSAGAGADFVQTGAARAPLAADGNGNSYLALDGVADFYQAGAAADWKFLNDGALWTIAIVMHRPAPGTNDAILDSAGGSSTNTGITFYYDGGTGGVWFGVTRSAAGAAAIGVGAKIADSVLTAHVLRFAGANAVPANMGVTATANDLEMRRRGVVVSRCNMVNPFANTSPSFTLTLGRNAASAAGFSPARFYEVLIVKRALSDRLIAAYEDYARAKYQIAGM